MKLTDLDNKKHAETALKETFELDFDVSSLNKSKTASMLKKVSKLVTEAKSDPNFYENQTKPSYMKLVFMEQALNKHYRNLSLEPSPQVVVEEEIINENEEVEKSQVILAAQDMVDQVQKMYENINDMIVKELPALVDSIQSEIGVNESAQFKEKAGEALNSLDSSLQEARAALDGALGTITGEPEMPTDDFGTDEELPAAGEEEVEMDTETEIDTDEELPAPDEDEDSLPDVVGREKR